MKRGKGKVNMEYGAKDIYKYYCDQTGNPHKLSQKQYGAILKDYWDEVIRKLMYENYEYNMPRAGNLRIIKLKKKIVLDKKGNLVKNLLLMDYKKSKDLWKKMYPDKTLDEIFEIKDKPVVYNLNKHTDGHRYYWWWDKRTCITKNMSYYKFNMCRTNDRLLAKVIKEQGDKLDFYTLKQC